MKKFDDTMLVKNLSPVDEMRSILGLSPNVEKSLTVKMVKTSDGFYKVSVNIFCLIFE